MIKKGLGKGLGALIESSNTENEKYENKAVTELKINEIEPNKSQPRRIFNDEKLIQLSESIRQHGVVQPIIVKKDNDVYRIVAGERRWRAARMAGLNSVPVIVKELSNKEMMELALIENIQREDLNPLEEAEAYERLIKDYNMTQDELAGIIGKSRSAIANTIRLLHQTDTIKGYIIGGELSPGHARALLAIEDLEQREKAAEEIIKKGLNVRDTEELVKKLLTKKKVIKEKNKNENYQEIEDKLKNIFGTKVEIQAKNKKGKIMIEYYSLEELDRILEMVDLIGPKETSQ